MNTKEILQPAKDARAPGPSMTQVIEDARIVIKAIKRTKSMDIDLDDAMEFWLWYNDKSNLGYRSIPYDGAMSTAFDEYLDWVLKNGPQMARRTRMISCPECQAREGQRHTESCRISSKYRYFNIVASVCHRCGESTYNAQAIDNLEAFEKMEARVRECIDINSRGYLICPDCIKLMLCSIIIEEKKED